MHDVIVIGGGPAGLTAAIYACRAGKSVLIIEKETAGGQITFSPLVENIPGFAAVSGIEFADKLVGQALSQGAEMDFAEVTGIEDHGLYKTVVLDYGERREDAKAVIVATGAKHRRLGLPKEEDFIGNGISFCAVCDGAFYKDQTVGMVGGGNSALVEAVLLADLVKKLYIFQDLPQLTGEKKLQDQLYAKENVEVICGVQVKEYLGGEAFQGVVIEDAFGVRTPYELDGLFVAIGLVPQNEAFTNVLSLNRWGYADVDEFCKTATPGVFVAGDCRSKFIRQVATAASDGAVAALAACDYVDGRG